MIPAKQRGSRGRGERGRAAEAEEGSRRRRFKASRRAPAARSGAAKRGAENGPGAPPPPPPAEGLRGHARRPPSRPRGPALPAAALSPAGPRHHVPPQDLLRVLQLAGLRLSGDQPRGGGRVPAVPPVLERQPQPSRPRRATPRRRRRRSRRGQRRGSPRSAPSAGQPGLAGREHPPPDGPRGECSASARPPHALFLAVVPRGRLRARAPARCAELPGLCPARSGGGMRHRARQPRREAHSAPLRSSSRVLGIRI